MLQINQALSLRYYFNDTGHETILVSFFYPFNWTLKALASYPGDKSVKSQTSLVPCEYTTRNSDVCVCVCVCVCVWGGVVSKSHKVPR